MKWQWTDLEIFPITSSGIWQARNTIGLLGLKLPVETINDVIEALGEIVNNLLKHRLENCEREFGVVYSLSPNSIMVYVIAPCHLKHKVKIEARLEKLRLGCFGQICEEGGCGFDIAWMLTSDIQVVGDCLALVFNIDKEGMVVVPEDHRHLIQLL